MFNQQKRLFLELTEMISARKKFSLLINQILTNIGYEIYTKGEPIYSIIFRFNKLVLSDGNCIYIQTNNKIDLQLACLYKEVRLMVGLDFKSNVLGGAKVYIVYLIRLPSSSRYSPGVPQRKFPSSKVTIMYQNTKRWWDSYGSFYIAAYVSL